MNRTISFLTDEQVHKAVTLGLRQRGVNVLSVVEAGMKGDSDEELLIWAKGECRTIFTQDTDFLRLHSLHRDHAGIAYATQRTSIGDIIRGLMLIYQLLDAEDMQGHIEFI